MKIAPDKPIVVTKEMQDVAGPDYVEILIDSNGRRVWINVDGVCRFRACRVKNLVLNDERKE